MPLSRLRVRIENNHHSVLSLAACRDPLQYAAGPHCPGSKHKPMTSSDLWPLALIPSDHINNNLFKFFLETDIKIAPVVTLSILSPHRSCHFTFYIAFDFSHGSGAGCSWPGSGQGRIINSLLSVCVLLIAMIPSLSEVSQQLALSWGCDNAPSHETINSGHFSSCPRVVSVREVHLMCICVAMIWSLMCDGVTQDLRWPAQHQCRGSVNTHEHIKHISYIRSLT